MIHEMRLNDVPFRMIKSGKKDIEMRLFDEKRRAISAGDTIKFSNVNTSEVLFSRVKQVYIFENFEALYSKFDKTRIGYMPDETPDPEDMKEYYTEEDIDIHGVCGIEIELIDDFLG